MPDVVYEYHDEGGQLLFQVVRKADKRFAQRRPGGNGGWVWNLNGTRRVLFRFPAVLSHLEQNRSDPIYVCEGEKDVIAIEAEGATATTCPMGAGKWDDAYSEMLQGARRVVVVADRDEPGIRHAQQVRESLAAVGIVAEVVQALEGNDAADHLAAGFGLDELVPFVPPPATAPDALAREFMHTGPVPTFMPAANFVRLDFPVPEVYLGTDEHVVLFRGCLAMIYGDEGAGKTTALIDLVAHTAAGLPWLELPLRRALIWLLIENESAPGMFQRLLLEKRERWEADAAWFDNVHVHGGEGLWGIFDFRQETHRQALWSYCRESKVDLVAVSPTFGVGGPGSGKPDETQAFIDQMLRPAGLWQDTGFVLLHHENKSGVVSGDWGRQPDTLIQFEREGDRPATRINWHKLRYSSELGERKRKQLLEWIPAHKGFKLTDVDLSGRVSDEELYARLDAYLSEHSNAITRDIKGGVTGTDEKLVQLLKAGVEHGRYDCEQQGSANVYRLAEAGGVRASEQEGSHTSLFGEENPHG
jgi:hypothetical protein